MAQRHEFVVVAYRQSPHLTACLDSLVAQTYPSPITISTSTPFDGLPSLASRYGARLVVHAGSGIGRDWNAALDTATAELVTLAHQDDVYRPQFAMSAVSAHAANPNAAFSFCEFDEIDSDGTAVETLSKRVKKMLVRAAFFSCQTIHGGWRRRVLLGFGNPIICPSVTLNRRVAPGFRFREDMRTNMDWAAWLYLSERLSIVVTPERLIERRVHLSSATSNCIEDGSRYNEDLQIFQMLWPAPLSGLIASAYRASYKGYLS